MQKKRLSQSFNSTKDFLLKISLLCCFALLSSFAVHAQCDNVDGGSLTFTNGDTETTTLFDGNPDVLSFATTVDAASNNHEFTYVITDGAGMVLGVPPSNMNDFEPAGLGVCRVYGLSYTGNLSVTAGDDLFGGQDLSDDCFDLSANHLKVKRVAPAATENTIVASSNTSGLIGVYSIQTDGSVVAGNQAAAGSEDSDGIAYDAANDKLYQLDRTFNRVYEYSTFSVNPTLTATTGANEFENGREIALVGSKIVVAQDANAANGDQNRFYIYDITSGAIVLEKIYDADINLWGIHADGDRLFAIQDNSNNVAVYDDFFNQPAGAITPSALVSIADLVRTHGITYDAASDRMFLTDIGDAGSANDGAIISIKNWSAASADGMVDASEQARAKGAASFLGNPVDIAFDAANNMVYVAERANGGGRILGFKAPSATGGIAPAFKRLFAGASAVYVTSPQPVVDPCDFVDGGTVSLLDGNTAITTIFDGNPDVLTFTSSIDPIAAGHEFTYVITDANGMVLGVPPGNMNDFDPAGLGACGVYGLSYTGNLTVMGGDDLFGGQDLSDGCFDLSDNSIVVTRVAPSNTVAQLFASSNGQGMVGVFDILEDNIVLSSNFTASGLNADGIYYDQDADVLYQLDRTNNVIVAYSDVSTSLAMGNTPPTTATSATGDFTNGREIAVNGNKLVVADDGDNNFVIYDISPTAITLDKVLNADINLWGIQFNGDQLIAISDNTNEVVTYDDFLNQPAGAIAPTATVAIEGLVRTHGITYDAQEDYMLLTDVGDGGNPNDGALFAIKNWTAASADGNVSAMEAVRVGGANSFLGNPVDVAYDKANSRVYIAEAANGGGRILGFKKPVLSGGIAPFYNNLFVGASAVNFVTAPAPVDPCAFVDGGTVAMPDGNTAITTVFDGEADVVMFTSSVDPVAAGHDFTYVITDANGMVLGVPPGNMNDFDPAGVGACGVYGLSYTGNLTVMAGDDLFGGQDLSDGCFDLSDNSIVVTRVENQAVKAQLFVSSNNQTKVGTYGVLADGSVVAGSFDPMAALDSDGIHYDKVNDVLYQVNRTDNVVNLYTNVSTNPTLAAVSATGNFTNARGLTVSGNKLVVADDVDDANKFIVYDITPTTIMLDKVLDADINLWGIHADGDRMIAIVDNSNGVAIYDDFFNQPAGAIAPTATVMIADMVRTHGLDYDAADDMLILTDVGSGADDNDGALVVVRDFAVAGADGMVDASEQARVFGGADFLGNPVDVALDKANKRIYVAERANGGGRLLGFNVPKLSGGVAPFYNSLYAGASSVFIPEGDCDFLTGGAITFDDGTTMKDVIVNDGIDDELFFVSDVDAAAGGYSQTFVITDGFNGNILGVPGGNSVNFETSGVGACRVYNVSYTGTLMLAMGGNLFTDQISDGCGVVSNNFLLTNRIENFAGNTGLNGTTATSMVANIFPVPVTNTLNVRVESTIELNGVVNIFNASGSRVSQDNVSLFVGDNTLSFDVATFENGMYFIQLPGSNEVTRFVKMNQ